LFVALLTNAVHPTAVIDQSPWIAVRIGFHDDGPSLARMFFFSTVGGFKMLHSK
jgi:hypothetical protein